MYATKTNPVDKASLLKSPTIKKNACILQTKVPFEENGRKNTILLSIQVMLNRMLIIIKTFFLIL